MASMTSLAFHVKRNEPEMIPPSKPTPYEFKYLSDHDDQKGLWKHIQGITIFQKCEKMEGRDAVAVIKQAVADALVHYYPLAGRLREGVNGKLMVECTGEGVPFIEANSQVTSDTFAGFILPPVRGADELLYDVPGSSDILHSPLVLIQFLTAVANIARGAPTPSISRVWGRELLNARNPPNVTCLHHAYHEIQETKNTPIEDMTQCSFFFGPEEISTLKNQLQPHLRKCSKFDILTASFWLCHTIALNYNPEDIVRLTFAVNARAKLNPPLPVGYYGNAYVKPVALSTAGELCTNSLGYALELVRKAKEEVTDEFVRSTADYLVKNGRPRYSFARMFHVSDLTSLAYNNIDFGIGKAVYGGTLSLVPPTTYFVSSKNNRGVNGTVAIIGLPAQAMKRFIIEIEKMAKTSSNHTSPSFLVSNL